MAECAICVRPRARAWATPGWTCQSVLGGDTNRRVLVRRVATVMMGDIGEEIIEIELEPLPEEMPAESPVEPTAEPVPG